MIIKSNIKDYTLRFEKDFSFFKSLAKYENVLFIIDENVYNLYCEEIFSNFNKDDIYVLKATEINKNIDTALEICERVTQIPAKRNAHIVSFGGGIVQDITGFAANILYRGIKWTFVPTTLLAACDSCIGAKTSLNYKSFKNLLGTFYPPENIIVCTNFFNTLSQADYLSGLGEVVKFNVLGGEKSLCNLEENLPLLLEKDQDTIEYFTRASLNFKKAYIEEDEFDRGKRIFLNFAHTFGHALETTSCYEIPHGTAVAIGTIMANYISFLRGILSDTIETRIKTMVQNVVKVVVPFRFLNKETFISAMKKDKKQTTTSLTAVLLDNNFQLHIVNNVTEEEVEKALALVNTLFGENE